MPTLLNPREMRRTHTIDIDLGDDTFVRAKKADMTLLMLEGKLPMPLLLAVQQMISLPNTTVEERIAALGSGDADAFVDLLRHHAVAVVIEPRLSLDETPDPDVLPVGYLQTTQLMTIWNETAVIPVVGRQEAITFRRELRPDDADVPPVSQGVRPAPEFVDPPADGLLVSR